MYMRIALENIGKINKTEVEISGITVIAGENDTGKSTVGKALYAVFNAFYQIEDKIKDEINNEFYKIRDWVGTFYSRQIFFDIGSFWVQDKNSEEYVQKQQKEKLIKDKLHFVNQVLEDIFDNREKYLTRKETLTKETLSEFLSSDRYHIEEEVIEFIFEQLNRFFSISTDRVLNQIVEEHLQKEFNGRINNIFCDEIGDISLKLKNEEMSIKVKDHEVVKIQNPFSIYYDIIYIENPFVLDGLFEYDTEDENWFENSRPVFKHQEDLKYKLSILEDDNTSIYDKIILKESLKSIYEKIDSVCEGALVSDSSSSGKIEFEYKNSGKRLSPESLSTGLKSFVIIKTLLKNGLLKENGTVILDEPEVHLHPKWQLLFAEIIVLLHKELGIHILLNTHSPYFLEAIEVYASKHEVVDNCKYYLSQQMEHEFCIEDVTDDIERIYQKLASPFQVLENERY